MQLRSAQLFLAFLTVLASGLASPLGFSASALPDFTPCDPSSDFSLDPSLGDAKSEPHVGFCAEWNPEFVFNGHHCCAKFTPGRKRAKINRCSPVRHRGNYCDEMTPEQAEYEEAAKSGKLGDLLTYITREINRRSSQAYCTVNNGFLAFGRPVVSTEMNRILSKSPDRCTNFGTDPMAGMLEWIGRRVAVRYPKTDPELKGVHLLIGDISAPRGGCLSGSSGRRGHASHTTGQDIDIGFLTVNPGSSSPANFHTDLGARTNWWLVKQIFKNPFACVKVIFLDRKHIRSLTRVAANDEDWQKYGRFLRHVKAHKNHFHVRIGEGPGVPGCVANARPDLETDDDADSGEIGTDLENSATGENAEIE